MHYEKYSFAIDKTVWTIRLKEKYDSKFIGQRLTLSPTDIRKINRMYNCEDIDPEKPPETISTPTTVARTLKTTDDSETNTFTHALATTTKNNLTKRPINVTPVEVANNNTATNMLSCISESYAGHCEDDDNPACNQACQNDSRGDGKCGPFRSFKICYCDGCPGTKGLLE
ncbi:hypothetical protein BV898_18986 [Hypsibius exemplaris]|uniref:Peptidase M12A domain-containing protein n=1 Tax=Hypsibius exemplaris TaxID=2072580 RepID=A0A9X6NKV8_HYPEX|nr:hypothetical protein BV898_18986 [Hypsibius exemplaris]